MKIWYALAGTEVVGPFETTDEWYHAHAGPDWRQGVHQKSGVDPWLVAYDKLADGRWVSTVFLGLDQNFVGEGPPVLFETMVFPASEICFRSSSWDNAVAAHQSAIDLCLATTDHP